jgi:hypothetical protein
MKPLLGSMAALFSCLFFFGQTPSSIPACDVAVVKFVAPPYPRAAKDGKITGRAVATINIARDGSVNVQTVRAHIVFEKPVRDALAKWRFTPTNQESTLEVIVSFEIDDTCEGTDEHPLTAETRVSAELPSLVHVVTGLRCLETNVSTEHKNQ